MKQTIDLNEKDMNTAASVTGLDARYLDHEVDGKPISRSKDWSGLGDLWRCQLGRWRAERRALRPCGKRESGVLILSVRVFELVAFGPTWGAAVAMWRRNNPVAEPEPAVL